MMTISDLFELRAPQPGAPDAPWRERLGRRLDEELRTLKWPTALPDFAKKLSELLDLPVPSLFFTSWKNFEEIQLAVKETREKTGETRMIELGQHTIETTWEPAIEVRLWKLMPLGKELKFPVRLEGTFKGLRLRIERGGLTGIESGVCELTGTVSLGEHTLATKEFGAVALIGALQDPAETTETKT